MDWVFNNNLPMKPVCEASYYGNTRSIQRSPSGKWFIGYHGVVDDTRIMRFDNLDDITCDNTIISATNVNGSIRLAINNSGYIFASVMGNNAATRGVWRSVDDGENWTRILDLTGLLSTYHHAIVPCGYDRFYCIYNDDTLNQLHFVFTLDNGDTVFDTTTPLAPNEESWGNLGVWKPTYSDHINVQQYHDYDYVFVLASLNGLVGFNFGELYRFKVPITKEGPPLPIFELIYTTDWVNNGCTHSLICEDDKLMCAYRVHQTMSAATTHFVQGSIGTSAGVEFNYGQHFTSTFEITHVNVYVVNIIGAPRDCVVKIYNAVAGLPVGLPLLTSDTKTNAQVVAGAYNRFEFPEPISFGVGAPGYIVMIETTAAAPGANDRYEIGIDGTNLYPGGDAVQGTVGWPPAFFATIVNTDIRIDLYNHQIRYFYSDNPLEEPFGNVVVSTEVPFVEGFFDIPFSLEYTKKIGDDVTGVVEENDMIHLFYSTDKYIAVDVQSVGHAWMNYNDTDFTFERITGTTGQDINMTSVQLQTSIIDGGLSNVNWETYVSPITLVIRDYDPAGNDQLFISNSDQIVNQNPFKTTEPNFDSVYEINKMGSYIHDNDITDPVLLMSTDTRLLNYHEYDDPLSGDYRHYNELAFYEDTQLDWEVGLQMYDKQTKVKEYSLPYYRPRSFCWVKAPSSLKETSIDTLQMFYTNNVSFPFSDNVWDTWDIVYHFDECSPWFIGSGYIPRPNEYRNYATAQKNRFLCPNNIWTELYGVIGRSIYFQYLVSIGEYIDQNVDVINPQRSFAISVWVTEPDEFWNSTFCICANRENNSLWGSGGPSFQAGFIFAIQYLGDGEWDFGATGVEDTNGTFMTLGSAPSFRFYDEDNKHIGLHHNFTHFGLVFENNNSPDNDILKVYINGELHYTESSSNLVNLLDPVPQEFYLGSIPNSAGPPAFTWELSAKMDEFRFMGYDGSKNYPDFVDWDDLMRVEYRNLTNRFSVFALRTPNPTNI